MKNTKFLDLFLEEERSKIFTLFLKQTRLSDVVDSYDILEKVMISSKKDSRIYNKIDEQLDDALKFAEFILNWSKKDKEYMCEQKPTEKQLNFLYKYGYKGKTPESKYEASVIIEEIISHNNF